MDRCFDRVRAVSRQTDHHHLAIVVRRDGTVRINKISQSRSLRLNGGLTLAQIWPRECLPVGCQVYLPSVQATEERSPYKCLGKIDPNFLTTMLARLLCFLKAASIASRGAAE